MKRACLVFLIDALGWEILEGSGIELGFLRNKRRLKTVLGYSSAAIPSLLSGRPPCETGHWAMYSYAPESSSFSITRLLSWLPRRVLKSRLSSMFLSWLVQGRAGIKGYYSLYEIPFEYLRFFDLCERKDIFSEGGLNSCRSIFDSLSENGIKYRVWDWRTDEKGNFKNLSEELSRGITQFFFFYTSELDALIHEFGIPSEKVTEKIRLFATTVMESLDTAFRHYDEVHAFILSDHGMAEINCTIDPEKLLDTGGFRIPDDFLVFLDSTMARFWFFSQGVRDTLTSILATVENGSVLSSKELKDLGAYFPDGRFGELIFLASPGTLIVPSFMGSKPLKAMHGFHPSHPGSDAMIASNRPLPELHSILEVFKVLEEEISWLKGRSQD